MPKIQRNVAWDFKQFAEAFIKLHFVSLREDELSSFNAWLDSCPYGERRKTYLSDVRKKIFRLDKKTPESKSFLKWEGYEEPKNPRAINSPSDESKTILGPLIHDVDKKTFQLKWFVKGTNPRDWPDLMAATFGDSTIMETDFKSFEAHHRQVYAGVVHFWVMHMIRNACPSAAFKRLVSKMMLGTNKTKFSAITAEVSQRLMSGCMWTSSGNGVLNLLIMCYLNARAVYPMMSPLELPEHVDEYFKGYVEGDDGICVFKNVSEQLIQDMGLVLSMTKSSHFGEAKFCGVICDAVERKIVSDPMKILRNFFVLPPKYKCASENKQMTLIRAKAMSYKYRLGNAPVVGSLCDRVLDATRSLDVSSVITEFDSWKQKELRSAIQEKSWKDRAQVSDRSRMIVSKKFHLSAGQQMLMEESIMAGTGKIIEMDLAPYINNTDLAHALLHLTQYDVSVPKYVNEVDTLQIKATDKLKRCKREDADYNNCTDSVPFDASIWATECVGRS